ncbi:class I SAM-dependent methyltransferase [Terriglobus aquaticus]|uniref:Class I SAM-dependent methyltransferase n=1 Tax=Terriglobus aquaticus TaxID=940139 RepID=A0ABW9KR55_9BACT|nr:class I SAM-dependent methyltransferase [Terriglobus aquaticus]
MILPRRKRRSGPAPLHPFDLLHGTETGALIPGDDLATGHRHDRHITAYHGTAPSLFRKLMAQWQPHRRHPLQQTAFVDVGAGKGRAMLLAAELPFRRILGIELHPALAASARRNLERFQRQQTRKTEDRPSIPMRLEEADVMRLRMPAGPCCVFLFNPFDLVLMDRFLDKLTRDFQGREDDLDLLYVNDEQRDLMLQEHPQFQEVWRGRIHLSREDRDADKAIIGYWAQGLYVTSGYEDCGIWRLRKK